MISRLNASIGRWNSPSLFSPRSRRKLHQYIFAVGIVGQQREPPIDPVAIGRGGMEQQIDRLGDQHRRDGGEAVKQKF